MFDYADVYLLVIHSGQSSWKASFKHLAEEKSKLSARQYYIQYLYILYLFICCYCYYDYYYYLFKCFMQSTHQWQIKLITNTVLFSWHFQDI